MSEKILIHVRPEVMDLLPVYIANRKKDVASLRELLNQNKYTEISVLGHKMKGGGKLYGMNDVTIMGDKLGIAALNADRRAIEEIIAFLEDYFGRVEVA